MAPTVGILLAVITTAVAAATDVRSDANIPLPDVRLETNDLCTHVGAQLVEQDGLRTLFIDYQSGSLMEPDATNRDIDRVFSLISPLAAATAVTIVSVLRWGEDPVTCDFVASEDREWARKCYSSTVEGSLDRLTASCVD
jgi:hypothetical protein